MMSSFCARTLAVLLGLCFFALAYSQGPLDAGNIYPLDKGWVTPDSLAAVVRDCCAAHPDIAHWEVIGRGGNLPIYAACVDVNPGVDKPVALIIGQHHSEEVLGIQISLQLLRNLTGGYGQDSTYTRLARNYTWWIIPTLNPTGANIVLSGQNRYQRKNYLGEGYPGVDLNHNYPSNWDDDPETDPESVNYKGAFPLSETETQALTRFAARVNPSLALSYHSSILGQLSEQIFLPFKRGDQKSADYPELLELARELAGKLPRDYRSGNYQVKAEYNSWRGTEREWLYMRQGTYAYTIETGGNNRDGVSVITPSAERMHMVVAKNLNALEHMAGVFKQRLWSVQVRYPDGTPAMGLEWSRPDLAGVSPRRVTDEHGFLYVYGQDAPLIRLDNRFDLQLLTREKTTVFTLPAIPPLKAPVHDLLVNGEAMEDLPGISYPWADEITVSVNHGPAVALHKLSDGHFAHPWLGLAQAGSGTITWVAKKRGRIISPPVSASFKKIRSGELSLADEITNINPELILPGSGLAVDFACPDWGGVPWRIDGVKLHGQNPSGSCWRVELYDKQSGKCLYTGTASAGSDNFKIDIPAKSLLMCPALRLVLVNCGTQSALVYREGYPGSHSGNCYFIYDGVMAKSMDDLAVGLLVKPAH